MSVDHVRIPWPYSRSWAAILAGLFVLVGGISAQPRRRGVLPVGDGRGRAVIAVLTLSQHR